MAQITVKVEGVDQIVRNVQRYGEQVRREVERIIARYALLIERDAKVRAPVDTGRLRASIHHQLQGLAAEVIAETEYAAFQEFGTSKMAAQPYMVPAVEAHRAAFIRELQDALRKGGAS